MGELQLMIRHRSMNATRRLPLLLCSIWIVFLVELMSRGGWADAAEWTVLKLPELALNALLVLGLMLLFTALTGKVRLSFWLVAAVCFIFSLISGIKQEILGVPFLPWDLFLTSETKDMAQYVQGLLHFTVISGVVTFALISVLLFYKLPRMSFAFHWKTRIVMGLASLLVLISMYSDSSFSPKSWAGVQNLAWDQTENVRTNGFLLSTVMNLKFLMFEQPDDYNEETIKSIASYVTPAVPEAGAVKPNIIVVLSESFWDATQIKDVSFSRDPLPFFHELTQKYSSGTMLSPQFGGGTANVEFEVLTGNSMRFLPQGSIPYNQYVDKEIDSLASILARQGYNSTAINPFHSWFYSSKKVYQNFGFANYISQEFFDPDYEGPYIADREVARQIIDASARTQGPDFIFANTMENHYHYYPGKFKENTIEVTGVSGETKGLLETYAQGLLGADDMLKRLVTHYEQIDEPTIVVFFGDHLPSLGDNYKAFKESGYLKEDDPDALNKMYRVPLLVWNNYMPGQREELNMSPSFLGPYVLKLAQRPGSYYTDYLAQLGQRIPLIPPKNRYRDYGVSEESLKAYEKLQYDIMFGQQYGYGELKGTIKKNNYVLGPGPMVIDQVQSVAADNGAKLHITGTDLSPGSLVLLNDKPVATHWVNSRELTAELPPDQPSLPCKVEVVVKDSRGSIVTKSRQFNVSSFVAAGL